MKRENMASIEYVFEYGNTIKIWKYRKRVEQHSETNTLFVLVEYINVSLSFDSSK